MPTGNPIRENGITWTGQWATGEPSVITSESILNIKNATRLGRQAKNRQSIFIIQYKLIKVLAQSARERQREKKEQSYVFLCIKTSLCHKNLFTAHDLATFNANKMHLLMLRWAWWRNTFFFCSKKMFLFISSLYWIKWVKKKHCRKLDLLTSNCTHDRLLLQHTCKVISGLVVGFFFIRLRDDLS